MHSLADSAQSPAPVWLLTGDRLGEIAQQRAIAQALGWPYRELPVAKLAAAGGKVQFDLQALQPPWPRLVISFGKTLEAAVELRRRSGGSVRIVQLGRPRGVAWASLDLIVPMPQDVVPDAPNILPVRMPFNPRSAPPSAPVLQRMGAAPWPRPWTLLVLGGVTRQYRFDAPAAANLLRDVAARVRARSRSLLITTSPRTPADVIAQLSQPEDVPGECYVFRRGDPDNPFTAYAQLADEIVLSGDSPSMLAECWRDAKPVLVRPPQRTLRYWIKRQTRHLISDKRMQAGGVAAALDIKAWLKRLQAEGCIGILGQSEPSLRYDAAADDDLQRVCARIRKLFD